MPPKLTRRKRRLITTTLSISLFLIVTFIIIWLSSTSEKPYRPGEKIEGLTDDLARSIPKDYPRVSFADATAEAKITFQHFFGRREVQLVEDMGSGAAWGDYNNDGWLDLFVVNEAGPISMTAEEVQKSPARCALYLNKGDGTFEDVIEQSGIDFRGWGMAAKWSDYDNDGWLDLFISCYGKNVFYQNKGNGTFTDITKQSGLGNKDGFWTGISWADYNRDGWLDLYVCGYVQYTYQEAQEISIQYDVEISASLNPSSFKPDINLFYQNNGDGTFTEIAKKAGVQNPKGRSLSAVWCDFDEDSWPDLYVANDVSDNALFRNLGNGTFEEISLSAWVADYRGAMGLAVGDWDGDADMDIFVTHWIAQENALYSNLLSQLAELDVSNTSLRFMDEADRYGLGQIALDYISWGTSFFDYDNDGNLDLFVTSGSTFQQKEKPYLLVPMTNQLFWNRDKVEDGFYDVSAVSGEVFKQENVGRGAAFADYDNDGDIDIFIVSNGGPAQLLKNQGGNSNNWLKVQVEGNKSNRQGIGAKLKLFVNDAIQVTQVGIQSSYCSQNSLIQHFGLGNELNADSLEVVWPSGLRQTLYDIKANQTIYVAEGEPAK